MDAGGQRSPAPDVGDDCDGSGDRIGPRPEPGSGDPAPSAPGPGAQALSTGRITRLERSEDPQSALRGLGLRPYPWSAGAGAIFSEHSHEATKHLYVLKGSIDFDGITLSAGEGILIPALAPHSAVVGPDGVTCIEAFGGS